MFITDIKLLWRDWRGGQLSLVLSALILAVTVVTAVSLLANRVELGLKQQVSGFLAADLRLSGGIAINDIYRQNAEEQGLRQAETATFQSVVYAGDNYHLASIKAVTDSYPLLGELTVSKYLSNNREQLQPMSHGPPVGEVWVAPRLLPLLGIDLGDRLEIGYATLQVTRLLINEPDSSSGFAVTGARVMMNQADLATTDLVRPGSRIRYHLLLSGADAKINAYIHWFESYSATLADSNHLRLTRPENANERLDDALQRGQSFLLLAGTVGVLLAGLALALASRRYAERLTPQVALLKSWGQSTHAIRRSYLLRLALIALIATLIGMLVGWLLHFVLLSAAQQVFSVALPAAGLRPWLVAAATGMICVLGFALPAMWHLPTIAPLRVLRRDIPNTMMGQGKRIAIGVVALMGLVLWYSGNIMMSLMFIGVLILLFGICGLIALQALRLTRRLGQWQGSYWRLGLANLWRRRHQTLVQLVAFSATIMLLLVMISLRTSLLADWQRQLPANAPNHFIVNVATDERDKVGEILTAHTTTAFTWYPLVRGRLTAVNAEVLSQARIEQADGLDREVNFTWSGELPANNTIVAGQWWSDEDSNTKHSNRFSMEYEVANDLGVKVGDVVEFSLGGRQLTATLSSIRQVDWQSMTPNFFIIFSPGTLDNFAPTWLTSVYINHDHIAKGELTHAVISQYPAVLVIDLSDIIVRIGSVMQHVTSGLEMILLLVLACGTLVLFAAIGASFDERLQESAVLRTLGSSKRLILGALTVEFVTLGIIAGLIASLGAEGILWMIQTWAFNMASTLHPEVWLLGVPLSVLLIGGLGVLRSRSTVRSSPLQALRHLQ